MKKIYALIAAVAMATTTFAQEALPYSANWQYKAEALNADGEVTDAEAGKPTADQSFYDLGGWVSVKTAGSRPFYIAVSSKKPVENTMEFVDAQQDPTINTSFLISPALNFGNESVKTISFKCGKDADDQLSSRLEVLYTTDYTGDPKTTEWTSLKANILPGTGLKATTMGEITVTTEVVASSVYLAIKADKATEDFSQGAKQAKIRVTQFKVTEKEKEINAQLPYEAKWAYKAELINALDSTFVPGFDSTNAGSYKEDPSNLDLNGWVSISEAGDRKFTVLANKNTEGNKRQVPNTMEWTDNKQSKENTTWFVSPKIDFSATGDKYINFQIGREAIDQKISNVDLLYSTDYVDDVKTATWTTIKSQLVPEDQVGLNPADGELTENLLAVINEKVTINNPGVTIAFKAAKVESVSTPGDKQTKIRIRNFKITVDTDPNSIINNETTKAAAFVANGELNIVNAEEVAKVELYNIAGQSAMIVAQPANTVSLNGITNGIYLVRLIMADGSSVTTKVAVK